MKRLLIVAAAIAAVGFVAIKIIDRGILEAEGDPDTEEGYIKRNIEHELGLVLGSQGSVMRSSDDLHLMGYFLNGGARSLQDVVIRVRYARSRGEPAHAKNVSLGRFAPMEQRKIDQWVTVWPEAEVWFEIEVERVVFAPDS